MGRSPLAWRTWLGWLAIALRRVPGGLARPLAALLTAASLLLTLSPSPVALGAPAAQAIPDPGAPGPLPVTRRIYASASDEAFVPTGWTRGVEFRARVTHPTDLSGGPYPLLIFLHGQHNVCYSSGGTFSFTWPCPAGFQSLPSYLGYDYLGDVLASQGFIVVSISANGINALSESQSTDAGMTARGELIFAHLQLWSSWNSTTTGTYGSLFTGRVNMNAIGLMGHSRGGEGVVRAYQVNAANGSPFGIKAVFPLAPADFNRYVINNVPLAVLLPYCDGDISTLDGVHYYDDARYNVGGDTGSKHTILVMGANHNFYNTIWTPNDIPGGFDDWVEKEANTNPNADDPHCNPSVGGNQRLSPAQQRGTAIAYAATFFRTYLREETTFAPIVQGDAPPPASAQTTAIQVSYHAPGLAAARRDVNRFLAQSTLTTNDLGGSVAVTNLTGLEICGGSSPEPAHCLSSTTDTSFQREPHTGFYTGAARGLSQLSLRWPNPSGSVASFRNAIPPASGDVSGYSRLQFRVSTVWGSSLNPTGLIQGFSVVLTDSAARTASAHVSDYSGALYYPPGSFVPVLPKAVLNTARIPMSAFGGVDLHNIRTVEFRFDQAATGWLLITDLAFANPVPAIASIGGFTPAAALVGSPVTINGSNLFGVTAVTFNGTPAAFTVNSTSQLIATVPSGATTGPIVVTTAFGTVSSPASFQVYVPTGHVGVQVSRPGGGPALAATLTARPTCGPIDHIQFGDAGLPFANASVSVTSPAGGPSNQTVGFTYAPTGAPASVSISIQRVVQSGGATVTPIDVFDGCGSWRTLVGGGSAAFN